MRKNLAGRPIIMISLDAISDNDINYLLTLPNFRKLASLGLLHRKVESIFISNTYPVHTSISTGVMPGEHGLFDNVIYDPFKNTEKWRAHKKLIKVKTLPERAREKGLVSCAMMYPCTPGEKIRYHLAEVPGTESMIFRGFKFIHYSSTFRLCPKFFRYMKKCKSFNYFGIDTFIAYTSRDLIAKEKADFYMLHLQDTDHQKHHSGIDSDDVKKSIEYDDKLLGTILQGIEEAERKAGGDPEKGIRHFDILIFSDHACMNIKENILPNDLLKEHGISFENAWFQTVNGACFLHISETISKEDRAKLDAFIEEFLALPGVKRKLTDEEMKESGAIGAGFTMGFTPYPGTTFGAMKKGQHGYTLDNDNYKIFYLEIGPGLIRDDQKGTETEGGCILEVGKKAINLVETALPSTRVPT
ncbi:MAG: ectonucleotide pyrophosphatase/phosphodiesterase [Clostridiales bacterium]|nr:ectonucleotide pyrophosphatase/phosphodiesterase [Clostridiales bacterium]